MKKFLFGFGLCLIVLVALAWTPTDRNFNRNQFGTNNTTISVASGALQTNGVFHGSLTVPPLTAGRVVLVGTGGLLTNDAGITFNSATDALTVAGTVNGNEFVGGGVGLTGLNANELDSGTVATDRLGSGTANNTTFLRGDQTWAATTGSGIPTLNGNGTNTLLRDAAYIGNLLSTNAYPVVRATVNAASSAQTLLEGWTGDTQAGSWTFRIAHATNGYLPASPPTLGLRFTNINDVQYHYGYNVVSPSAALPQWIRGHEMTWFNPFNEPVMEFYDRFVLTNFAPGVVKDSGFGYNIGLESGNVAAGFSSHSLAFNIPGINTSYMSIVASTNNEAVVNMNKAQLNFINNTNEWLIMDNVNSGLIGAIGSNTLFASGGGLDTINMFKGANALSSDLQLWLGSHRAFRFDGTNTVAKGNQYWDQPNGEWRAFNDGRFSQQRSYTIPLSTAIGETNGDFRTIGSLTNITTDVFHAVIVQFDLTFYGIGSMRTVYVGNDANAHTDWQELLPIYQAKRNDLSRFAIDVRVNNNQKEFRLRRTGATDITGGSSFQGIVTVWANNNNSTASYWPMKWITDVSGSGAGATVSQIDVSTPMILTTGKAGIGTNNPQESLHVVGNVIASTGFSSSGANFTRMPTNTPTDGYVMTAAGTAGYTKWAAGGSGSTLEYANAQDVFTVDGNDSVTLNTSAGNPFAIWSTAADSFTLNVGGGVLLLNNGGLNYQSPGSTGGLDIDDTGVKPTGPDIDPSTLLGVNASGYLESVGTSGNPITSMTVTELNAGTIVANTNINYVRPDFLKFESLLSTNAAFVFLAPTNVNAAQTIVQECVVMVTNTTAAMVAITAPANCRTTGTANVTNVTEIRFKIYPKVGTNMMCVPWF